MSSLSSSRGSCNDMRRTVLGARTALGGALRIDNE